MKKEYMPLKLFIATAFLLVSINLHAATVYNISTSAGAAQISGTITTDGSIGRVDIASILGWDLYIDTPLVNFQLNNSNSVIWPSSVHGFDATSTELFFNHSEPWLDGTIDHLQFIDTTTQNLWCLDSSLLSAGCVNQPRTSAVFIQEFYPTTFAVYESMELGLEKIGTVSAVPVPAAAWLFASGLIVFLGFSRRNT
jgi:hypothetical protein